jgi:hypothetical protein
LSKSGGKNPVRMPLLFYWKLYCVPSDRNDDERSRKPSEEEVI